MLQILRSLAKAEYVFQPMQLIRRLSRRGSGENYEWIRLPWGLSVFVGTHLTIGRAIWHLGVYELVVSETLWRLIDPGEATADVGANFGYMTSLMGARAGSGGVVHCFEPHPLIYSQLTKNVDSWNGRPVAKIHAHPFALAEKSGNAELVIPENFSVNAGTAFIRDAASAEGGSTVKIELRRMDQVFEGHHAPQVIKVDTEGSEVRVFQGAGKLLSEKRIRDIVFEDHGVFPTAAMSFLLSAGYSLFKLERSLFGPKLISPEKKTAGPVWEPSNFLATLDPERAQARLSPLGWQCLKKNS